MDRFRFILKMAAFGAGCSLVLWPSGVARLWASVVAHQTGGSPWLPWEAWGILIGHHSVLKAWAFVSLASVAGAAYLAYKGTDDVQETTYGSAKWRNAASYPKTLARWVAGKAQGASGLVVGVASSSRKVRSAWVTSRDDHAILLGAPGAGKSTFVVMPTLGVLAESGDSVVVTDPKGELYETSAALFPRNGYHVVRLDLREPSYSVRWNPMTAVADQLRSGKTAEATRTARELAQVLSAQGVPQGDNGQFWEKSTVALLTALILAVADKASDEQRHLASVYHTLISTKDLDAFFDSFPQGHPASQAYGPVKLSGQETRQNQLAVAAASLQLFSDPSVAWLTSKDEISLEDISRPGTAVFVIVPDESSVYYGLASLFVQQVFKAFSAAAAKLPRQRLVRPVHMVLDEFGNLPRLPNFEKMLTVGRGKGIRVTLVLQALSQLDDRYGPQLAKVMRNSCNTWIYLSSNDVETAELVSQKTGQSTISVRSRSRSRYDQDREQETFSETGRALVTMDEVLRWPMGESLLLQSGQLPARLRLRRYDAWPFPFGEPPPISSRDIDQPEFWSPEEKQGKRFSVVLL